MTPPTPRKQGREEAIERGAKALYATNFQLREARVPLLFERLENPTTDELRQLAQAVLDAAYPEQTERCPHAETIMEGECDCAPHTMAECPFPQQTEGAKETVFDLAPEQEKRLRELMEARLAQQTEGDEREWTITQAGWSDAVDDFVVDGPDIGPPSSDEPTVIVVPKSSLTASEQRVEKAEGVTEQAEQQVKDYREGAEAEARGGDEARTALAAAEQRIKQAEANVIQLEERERNENARAEKAERDYGYAMEGQNSWKITAEQAEADRDRLQRELTEAKRRSGDVCPQCGFVRGSVEE